jgi:predicted Holliday junction resolvase-like endonuclease
MFYLFCTIVTVISITAIFISIYKSEKKKNKAFISELNILYNSTKEEVIKLKNEYNEAELLKNKAIFEQGETLKTYIKEKQNFNDVVLKYEETIVEYRKERETEYNKLLGQKKSSEVRVGKIGENMAPFLSGWPYDPNDFRFLGSPIDGIQFNEDELVFVEIKTGKSVLSKKQRWIKQLIREGKVNFATFRINENGTVFNKEEL